MTKKKSTVNLSKRKPTTKISTEPSLIKHLCPWRDKKYHTKNIEQIKRDYFQQFKRGKLGIRRKGENRGEETSGLTLEHTK